MNSPTGFYLRTVRAVIIESERRMEGAGGWVGRKGREGRETRRTNKVRLPVYLYGNSLSVATECREFDDVGTP